MKNIEQRAVLYCGLYSIEEHEQVLARMSMKGGFNRILRAVRIPYSP